MIPLWPRWNPAKPIAPKGPNNSMAAPKLIAIEKSGRQEILDPEVFGKIFKSEERP
jgi:hypothetical protein